VAGCVDEQSFVSAVVRVSKMPKMSGYAKTARVADKGSSASIIGVPKPKRNSKKKKTKKQAPRASMHGRTSLSKMSYN